MAVYVDYEGIKRIADGTFQGFEKRAEAILHGSSSPETLEQAQKLKLVCTERIRLLRAAKSDVVRNEAKMQDKRMASSAEDRSRLTPELAGFAETKVHIESLIVEVERSKTLAKQREAELARGEQRSAPTRAVAPADRQRATEMLEELGRMGVLTNKEVIQANERLVLRTR